MDGKVLASKIEKFINLRLSGSPVSAETAKEWAIFVKVLKGLVVTLDKEVKKFGTMRPKAAPKSASKTPPSEDTKKEPESPPAPTAPAALEPPEQTSPEAGEPQE